MNQYRVNRVISFTTEDGRKWTLAEFCDAHGLKQNPVRLRYYKLGRPEHVKAQELLPGRHGSHNELIIVLIMPDGTRQSVTMSEMGEICNRHEGKNLRLSSHYDRWVGMGRPEIVKLTAVLKRKPSGRAANRVDLSGIPDGDLVNLNGEMTRERENKLRSIPGPTKWEREHLNDAGRFGGVSVQRDNFAGNNGSGFPVYTGA